ncbi:Cct2 protein [Lentinula raphanica]|nr:Cct2 protein [Lentinula raphanica]
MSMQIFNEQATEEKAENARLSSFVGALALGDLVKSTLGPKGMNKILQSASTGEINVTNDGATILKAIQLDNAAAKILVNISKVQDDEVGDGTTSVCIKIFGAQVKVDGTGKLAELERAEREKMKAKVDAIASHGINCFVNRQLVYNYPESLFAEKGIMVIEHADFEGVERLSLVTGGEIASTFDRPDLIKLGECELIEEVIIGEDKLIKFSGVAAGEACTVVLRGSTSQMVDEAERSLHDALSVLSQTVKETRTVLGGGCSEMLMSCAVDEEVRKVKGKKAIAAEAFGRALRQMPTILADNAGYDSSDLVAKLRAAHYEGQSDAGLDMNQGTIGSMSQLGVTESYKLKRQVVLSASEAAEMIIRVDDILRAAPRKREAV